MRRDVTWYTMRLLPLTMSAVLADLIGIAPLRRMGGTLLAFAGVLELALPGGHDLRHVPVAQSPARSFA